MELDKHIDPAELDKHIDLTKKCLSLIHKIAAEGANSTEWVPVEFAFQELSGILVDRLRRLTTWPVPDESEEMIWLLSELGTAAQHQEELKGLCREHQV